MGAHTQRERKHRLDTTLRANEATRIEFLGEFPMNHPEENLKSVIDCINAHASPDTAAPAFTSRSDPRHIFAWVQLMLGKIQNDTRARVEQELRDREPDRYFC